MNEAIEIIKNLMQFRWKWMGYGKLHCSSCGSEAYEEGMKTVRLGHEECSISCPWRKAEEFLERNGGNKYE